jgi:hypothetical protein
LLFVADAVAAAEHCCCPSKVTISMEAAVVAAEEEVTGAGCLEEEVGLAARPRADRKRKELKMRHSCFILKLVSSTLYMF